MMKVAVPLYSLIVFGLDITAVMVLVLIQNFFPLLLRPLFGSLADRYGKKTVFVISFGMRTAVSLFYVFATLPLLFLFSVIRGIADSAKGPSVLALIADNTDEKHIAKVYSWHTTMKSVAGGIGEALTAFALVALIITFVRTDNVTATVAIFEGAHAEEIIKSADEVSADQTLPGDEHHEGPRKVLRVEQRQVRLNEVPIEDLPKVINAAPLRLALVAIFIASTIFSALSLLLVTIFTDDQSKPATLQKELPAKRHGLTDKLTGLLHLHRRQPHVWSFALLGAALSAPAYMAASEFFIILSVKLNVTPYALGWIKILAETITPLLFGPFFGWLADRIGSGKVIALHSFSNLGSSLLFWMAPWYAGTALLGFMMGAARAIDEIGEAAFKPTWGAISAKVSSLSPANRGKTLSIMESGVEASDLTVPLLAGVMLQYLSLGVLMAVRAALSVGAEVYGHFLMHNLTRRDDSA